MTCENCGCVSDSYRILRQPPGPCPWLPPGYEEALRAREEARWRYRAERARKTESLTVAWDPANPAEGAALLMAKAAELMQAAAIKGATSPA